MGTWLLAFMFVTVSLMLVTSFASWVWGRFRVVLMKVRKRELDREEQC